MAAALRVVNGVGMLTSRNLRYVAAVVAGIFSPPSLAQIEVDVELVLAVDVSRSMDMDELLLQRNGYVAAFRHPEVIRAIERGLTGRIAVTYFEWAGPMRARIVVPWTILSSGIEANGFADLLADIPPRPQRGTSISGGLAFANRLFDQNEIAGLRRVITRVRVTPAAGFASKASSGLSNVC